MGLYNTDKTDAFHTMFLATEEKPLLSGSCTKIRVRTG